MIVVSFRRPPCPAAGYVRALQEKTFKRKFKHFLIKRINIHSFL